MPLPLSLLLLSLTGEGEMPGDRAASDQQQLNASAGALWPEAGHAFPSTAREQHFLRHSPRCDPLPPSPRISKTENKNNKLMY